MVATDITPAVALHLAAPREDLGRRLVVIHPSRRMTLVMDRVLSTIAPDDWPKRYLVPLGVRRQSR